MGRMKEIYMEIQEKFDGNIPSDFDFEAYIDKKLKQTKSFSSCCGTDMSTLTSEDGPSFEDLEICPSCHEHCGIEK